MSISGSIVTYLILWWMVLFMVLPWGITRVDPDQLLPGEDPASPAKGNMVKKLAATTVISFVLYGLVYFIITSGIVSLRPEV